MNASRLPLSLSCVLGLLAASAAPAQTLTLVDANFNNVTASRVAAYPPSPGTRFREILPGFGGWSGGGGQIQITQAPGYGADSTGGLHFEVLKEGKFYQASFSKLAFPMLQPGKVIREPLRSLRFSVDAKIPAGKEVIVYLAVEVPKDVLPESPWSKRLVLGSLRGTDAYKRYTLSGAEVPEDILNIFINFVRDVQLNGMQQTVCGLTFHLDPGGWLEGEGLLFDNVKLTVDGS